MTRKDAEKVLAALGLDAKSIRSEIRREEVYQPSATARRKAIDEMLLKHGVPSGRVPRSYPRPGVGRFSCCQSYNG